MATSCTRGQRQPRLLERQKDRGLIFWVKVNARGSGNRVTNDGSVMLYSGHTDTHVRGAGLIVSKEKANTLLKKKQISDRMMRARFNSKDCKLTAIKCYAPTNEAEEEDKDNWYEQLQLAVSSMPMITGDMNAKVGADNANCDRAMGKHGCGEINDNGERLIGFCLNETCEIGGTIPPHRNIHRLTWRSPHGTTVNQIDHFIVNKKWRRSPPRRPPLPGC